MGKIDRITKDIDKKKVEILKYEDKIHEAREMHKKGRIDKDQWTKAKNKYQRKIRECRSNIHHKEKARLHYEKEKHKEEK